MIKMTNRGVGRASSPPTSKRIDPPLLLFHLFVYRGWYSLYVKFIPPYVFGDDKKFYSEITITMYEFDLNNPQKRLRKIVSFGSVNIKSLHMRHLGVTFCNIHCSYL